MAQDGGRGVLNDAGVAITPATPADADAITTVYLAARAEALPYLRRVHSDADTRRWVRDTMMRRCSVWVARPAEPDGTAAVIAAPRQVLGFIALDGEHLDQLYVQPGHFRRGIGARLLDHAKRLSPGRLRLFTFQRNRRARAFYEAHGFRVVDLNDGSRNEEGEPDVQYAWAAAATLRRTP